MSEHALCWTEPTTASRGLRPFAKAFVLSLAAHAALVGAFWHVISNERENLPHVVRVDLAPSPHAQRAVAAAAAPAAPTHTAAATDAGATKSAAPVHTNNAHSEARAPAPIAAAPTQASAPAQHEASAGATQGDAEAAVASAAQQAQPGNSPLDLRVLDWLAQYRSYPLAARRAHLEGVVQLRVTLLPDGRLVDARVAQSSGHPLLDQAALDLLAHAAPLPADFGSARSERIELELPIVYRMRSSST